MQFDTSHTDALMALMRWRRDVRHFTDQAVPDDCLAALNQAMALAPSVGNSQPWRVINVVSDDLRKRIIASHEAANRDAALQFEGARQQQYLALKLAALKEAPVQLAVFTEGNPAEGHGLGRRTMPETLFYSTVLAIHGLWLTARSLNLGVGWVSILDPREVERILDVPVNWHLTAYLSIGYPRFADDTPELERAGWQERVATAWLVK